MAEFVSSQRCKDKLLHEGFLYTRDRARGCTIYWKCELRKSCCGRAVAKINGENVEVRITKEHTHGPRRKVAEVQRAKANLKRKAVEQPFARSGSLILEELEGMSGDAMAALPKRQTLQRLVNRSRASLRPALCPEVAGPKIVTQYERTLSGRQFVLHDTDKCGFVVFATEENVHCLFSSNTWYVSGPTRVVPNCAYHLWTFHGHSEDNLLPLVHAITSSEKSNLQAVFERLMESAKKLELSRSEPDTVFVDSLQPAENNWRTLFTRSHIRMPLYQVVQSLLLKADELGLRMQGRSEDGALKQWLLGAIGLAFVPHDEIAQSFRQLLDLLNNVKCDESPKFEELAEYFNRTFVNAPKTLETPTQSNTGSWNVYERSLYAEMRLNNEMKNWHSLLGKVLKKTKKSLFAVFDEVRRIQNDVELGLLQANAELQNFTDNLSARTALLCSLVDSFPVFKDNQNLLLFLTTVGQTVFLLTK